VQLILNQDSLEMTGYFINPVFDDSKIIWLTCGLVFACATICCFLIKTESRQYKLNY
jgi:hypothetical protein